MDQYDAESQKTEYKYYIQKGVEIWRERVEHASYRGSVGSTLVEEWEESVARKEAILTDRDRMSDDTLPIPFNQERTPRHYIFSLPRIARPYHRLIVCKKDVTVFHDCAECGAPVLTASKRCGACNNDPHMFGHILRLILNF